MASRFTAFGSWLALAAALLSAPAGRAQVLDGWGSAGSVGNPAPVYSQSLTTGVTTGLGALRTDNPMGGFWGPSTANLAATTSLLNALRDAARITFDVTMNSTELSGDGSNFSGFAQTNVMSVQLFSNPGGTLPNGINVFSQRTFGANDTDSRNLGAQWSGVNGTRTIAFDLTTFTGTDATDGQTKTISQMITQHPDITFAKINFVQQVGGGPGPLATFYWDNVRLLNGTGGTLATIGNFEPIPEPTSLALTALAVPTLAAAIRRRRAARAA